MLKIKKLLIGSLLLGSIAAVTLPLVSCSSNGVDMPTFSTKEEKDKFINDQVSELKEQNDTWRLDMLFEREYDRYNAYGINDWHNEIEQEGYDNGINHHYYYLNSGDVYQNQCDLKYVMFDPWEPKDIYNERLATNHEIVINGKPNNIPAGDNFYLYKPTYTYSAVYQANVSIDHTNIGSNTECYNYPKTVSQRIDVVFYLKPFYFHEIK